MPHIVDDVKTVIDNIPFIDDHDWPDYSTKGIGVVNKNPQSW
jgi:hypothetical protein